MRRPHTLLATLLLAAGTAAAQDYGQAATLKIWDNTTAPHSNGIATPEREPEPNRIVDVSQAVLYIFPADPAKATGQAVVICPGGGYVKLCIDYEGYDMAKWFAANGITAAVLKYRMPNGHPEVPLEDVEQALRIMMGLEAGATGFTAGKVGIVGSSAGGHLAASASTLAESPVDVLSTRQVAPTGRVNVAVLVSGNWLSVTVALTLNCSCAPALRFRLVFRLPLGSVLGA